MNMNKAGGTGTVNTPLGRGRIVFKLKDGTYVVEFEHGGGKIFLAEELWPCLQKRPGVVEVVMPLAENR